MLVLPLTNLVVILFVPLPTSTELLPLLVCLNKFFLHVHLEVMFVPFTPAIYFHLPALNFSIF